MVLHIVHKNVKEEAFIVVDENSKLIVTLNSSWTYSFLSGTGDIELAYASVSTWNNCFYFTDAPDITNNGTLNYNSSQHNYLLSKIINNGLFKII